MKNLTGMVLGKLTVGPLIKRSPRIYMCFCSCGKQKQYKSTSLLQGRTRSCGCSRRGSNNYKYNGFKDITGTYVKLLKSNAKNRGMSFEINSEHLWDLFQNQKGLCALSGLPLMLQSGSQTASLDRIDSSVGYIKGNLQWLHKDVNVMKWDFTEEYFKMICSLIYKTSIGEDTTHSYELNTFNDVLRKWVKLK